MASLKTNSNQDGFTIIEVLLTVFLIGVTVAIYQVTSQALLVNLLNRHKEVALRIADQKMQNLRATDYASLPATGSFSDPLLSSLNNGTGTVTVANVNAQTKRITVAVSWVNSKNNTNQKVELETFMTDGGLGQ